MKLPRPHIPLRVRVTVAHRQLVYRGLWTKAHIRLMADSPMPAGHQLKHAIGLLFEGRKVELHHRPALENREKIFKDGVHVGYRPHPNNPDFLIYLENNDKNNDHYIETHVRGVGARRSDTGERNHQKAMERNRGLRPSKKSRPIKSRGFASDSGPGLRTEKRKWPTRKFGKQ